MLIIPDRNHPERLDPALIRAGRFDVKIQFTNAVPAQAQDLFQHFFPLEDFLAVDEAVSIAKFGYDTSFSPSYEKLPTAIYDERADLLKTGLQTEDDKLSFGIISQLQIDDLAAQFVDGIFPTSQFDAVGTQSGLEISMATLQGYLLKHKDNPFQAVDSAVEWAKSQRNETWSTSPGKSLTRPVSRPSQAGHGGKLVLGKPKKSKGLNAVKKVKKAEVGEETRPGGAMHALGYEDVEAEREMRSGERSTFQGHLGAESSGDGEAKDLGLEVGGDGDDGSGGDDQ